MHVFFFLSGQPLNFVGQVNFFSQKQPSSNLRVPSEPQILRTFFRCRWSSTRTTSSVTFFSCESRHSCPIGLSILQAQSSVYHFSTSSLQPFLVWCMFFFDMFLFYFLFHFSFVVFVWLKECAIGSAVLVSPTPHFSCLLTGEVTTFWESGSLVSCHPHPCFHFPGTSLTFSPVLNQGGLIGIDIPRIITAGFWESGKYPWGERCLDERCFGI